MNRPEPQPIAVRPIDPANSEHITLVAERMRATLVEVIGPEGHSMYTLDWLRDRVRHHLRPEECIGNVFLAQDVTGEVIGHTIVRIEDASSATPLGLISTIYVLPSIRRFGVARALLDAAELWLAGEHAATFATDTSETNLPLIRLMEKRGYQITLRSAEKRMVRLSRNASPTEAG
jgi:GNAT superfamily N-acetyltransferase